MFLVIAANTLFQIVSVFTGWMLVIDQSNRYSHGPGYVFYMVVYLLILLLVILEFALFGHDYRRRNRFSLFAILILIVTGTAFQELLGGEVRTAYIALAVSLALLFIHNSEFAQLESDDRIHEQMVRISVDPLTGIASRYAYTSAVQQLDSMDSLPEDLVVYSIDINGLKTVNDKFGHQAGDLLLRAVVKACKDLLRESDVLFRMGGDEFMVLCPDTDKAGALICAERMQKAVGDITIVDQKVSFAYGIAYSGEVYKDMDEMLHSADASMYECKKKMHAGRE